ncbi:hypothetical protein [Sorangium sp. So ce1000]|uniref:hypothetical protein n=1 Tax=Sorangium sp. So ce1000 TaxID=3133325 RepID=UPI003F6251E4
MIFPPYRLHGNPLWANDSTTRERRRSGERHAWRAGGRGGGGGAGGVSYGLYRVGTSSVSLLGNVLTHGSGGAGGSSTGFPGTAGLSGNSI